MGAIKAIGVVLVAAVIGIEADDDPAPFVHRSCRLPEPENPVFGGKGNVDLITVFDFLGLYSAMAFEHFELAMVGI